MGNVVPINVKSNLMENAKLRCTGCGAETDAPCGCGKPFEYIPAVEAAAMAVAAHPEKSARAIAADVGVAPNTVLKAMKTTGVQSCTPEKRVGRDGKKQAATKRGERKSSRKPDEIQIQISANVKPEIWQKFKAQSEKLGMSAAARVGEIIAEDTTGEKKQPSSAADEPKLKRAPLRVIQHFPPTAPPMKHLTRAEVDPEFKGTPTEWTDKYGHVQIMTAEQYATMRFGDWVSNAKALVRCWKEQPPIRDVDHNWLRNPKPYDVTKLTEALEFLRPKIAELEALLAVAVDAAKKKEEAKTSPTPDQPDGGSPATA